MFPFDPHFSILTFNFLDFIKIWKEEMKFKDGTELGVGPWKIL
jgi:hypothetical protein